MADATAAICAGVDSLPNALLAPNFCAFEYTINVTQPRSILSLGTADAIVLERGSAAVVLLQDTDDDDIPDTKRSLVTADDLNHGLAVRDNYLFASSDTTVYRWAYTDQFENVSSVPTIVVQNINADGHGGAPLGHQTRTLTFDSLGRLYVSVGSMTNVDKDAFRSNVRRFDLGNETAWPLEFLSGEIFAQGMRNEVGLAFDRHGVLWGVENGGDDLMREDLGGDIHDDNPAEELNRIPEELAGSHYGYPFCWTEYSLPDGVGLGRGSVWAWPFDNNTYSDEQCRTDFIAPALAIQAHSAPLGIVFYQWVPDDERPANCSGGFPQSMDGYAFLALHGSWDRDPPTGYKVVYVAMDANGTVATNEPVDLLAHASSDAKWEDGFRPVDVDFDACGRLLVTSDGSKGKGGSKVVRVQSFESGTLSPSPSPIPNVVTAPPVTTTPSLTLVTTPSPTANTVAAAPLYNATVTTSRAAPAMSILSFESSILVTVMLLVWLVRHS